MVWGGGTGCPPLRHSERTRMRVCTLSGAFKRLPRDMHARRGMRVNVHACVRARAFRRARMASSNGKMGDKVREGET